MKDAMMKYRKLEEIRHNDFRGLPDYIAKEKSLEKVRLAYRVRTKMVADIKQNYKNSHKAGLQCDWSDSGEEELDCHVYRLGGGKEGPQPGQNHGHGQALQEDPRREGQE